MRGCLPNPTAAYCACSSLCCVGMTGEEPIGLEPEGEPLVRSRSKRRQDWFQEHATQQEAEAFLQKHKAGAFLVYGGGDGSGGGGNGILDNPYFSCIYCCPLPPPPRGLSTPSPSGTLKHFFPTRRCPSPPPCCGRGYRVRSEFVLAVRTGKNGIVHHAVVVREQGTFQLMLAGSEAEQPDFSNVTRMVSYYQEKDNGADFVLARRNPVFDPLKEERARVSHLNAGGHRGERSTGSLRRARCHPTARRRGLSACACC